MQKQRTQNIEPSEELIKKNEELAPILNIKLLDKSVTLKYNREEVNKFTESYIKSVLFKWYAMPYFNDLNQIYYEIRYSFVRAKSHIELHKKTDYDNINQNIHAWRIKYYSENLIYRYYSLWELVGRFLNCYFNLKLDVSSKKPEKEKTFFFSDVLKIVTAKYNHHLLLELFQIWGNNQRIFKYRMIKTHKRNPVLENTPASEFVRKYVQDKSTFTLKKSEGVSIQKFEDICEQVLNSSKRIIELCGIFFDIGHDEVQKLEKVKEKPKIITLEMKSINSLNKMLKTYSKNRFVK